jgi:zinc protease
LALEAVGGSGAPAHVPGGGVRNPAARTSSSRACPSEEQDPNYLADREFRRQIYGSHPYSRTVRGELGDVKKLAREHVVEWWKRYARPDASILYISGATTPDEAFRLAEQHFGAWKAEGEAPKPEVPPIPERKPTHIYLVDNPGAVQSQIRVGQTSITRGDPRYHQARVYSQILGGDFSSRLNDVIRVQKGLTYGAGGGVAPGRFTGTFTAHTFTKTPTTAETVQAVLEQVDQVGPSGRR